jgi:hypothetical protein
VFRSSIGTEPGTPVGMDEFVAQKPEGIDAESVWSVGCYGCGVNLIHEAWPKSTVVFEVSSHGTLGNLGARPHAGWTGSVGSIPLDLMHRKQLDVFVADHSRDNVFQTYGPRGGLTPWWYTSVLGCPPHQRPKIIIQVWRDDCLIEEHGPTSQNARKPLEKMGYESRYQIVRGERVGSAVSQSRLFVTHFLRRGPIDDRRWRLEESKIPPRPMSNCLRPFGSGRTQDSPPPTETTSVPHSRTDSMPSKCGAWINTNAGYRRLHADELAKGLGVPSSWNRDAHR